MADLLRKKQSLLRAYMDGANSLNNDLRLLFDLEDALDDLPGSLVETDFQGAAMQEYEHVDLTAFNEARAIVKELIKLWRGNTPTSAPTGDKTKYRKDLNKLRK